jgi:hypothetical protein
MEKNPGLKPVFVETLFVGLKPHASTEEAKTKAVSIRG